MNDEKTTHDLLKTLQSKETSSELDNYVSALREEYVLPFHEYFQSLPGARRFTNAELIRRSGIERTYYYQLINGRRKPGRDKIILLGIAAELSVKEVQRALEMNQLGTLYAKNRRDSILIFALQNHLDLTDTQELLMSYDQEILA